MKYLTFRISTAYDTLKNLKVFFVIITDLFFRCKIINTFSTQNIPDTKEVF